jgi:ABC-2 type transport system permease protein
MPMTETVLDSHATKRSGLPSDLQQVGVVAKYDVLKYLRSRRLLGMVVIEALALLLITVVLATSAQDFTADQVMYRYASFVSIIVILGATLFGGDAIVSEFQSRTGYLLFPNPIKKASILAGKFIASVGAMFLMLAIYYAVAFAAGFAIGDGFADLGVGSMLLAMLYGVSALAVAYLISSFMKGATGALILTFFLFLLILDIASGLIGALGGVNPWFLINFAGSSLLYITMWPYPVNSVEHTQIAGTQSITTYTFVPDIGVSIAVMVAYIVVALLLSYVLFKRREMAA